MSYDVSLTDEREADLWANYTSNMRPFFVEFVGGVREMDGRLAADVADAIDRGLSRIARTTSRDLEQWDAPNGWGSWQTATDFLRTIRDACRESPRAIVEVSY